jgi:2-succinyl-6-hydroxy-2,4-cyclohexadiene-1-carboxylate synthase
VKVVLLHGFLGGSWAYEGVLAACRRSHDVLVPPLSFHGPMAVETVPRSGLHVGRATETVRATRFTDEVRRVASEIRQFAGSSKIMLVGYSMGGRLALGVSIHFAELVARLVLISTRRGMDSRAERAARIASDERWARILEQEGLVPFLERWAAQPMFDGMRRLPADVLEREHQRRLTHDPQALACALRRLGLGRQPSYAREIRQLQVPVSILAGEHDQKFLSLSERLVAELPRAQRIVVEGASHQVLLEAPDWVSRIIDEGYES